MRQEVELSAKLPLESPRLMPRRMGCGDLSHFLAYRNDPRVARFQSWETMTEAAALAFLEVQESQEPFLPGQWLQLAITLKPTQLLIGDCALRIHADDDRQAAIGATLAHDYHGRGLAMEAIWSLLSFAFGQLGLHRVRADTDPENTPAWRLLEALGFRREGHLKQSLWFKGRWADEYLYSILAEEWSTHQEALRQRFQISPGL